MVPETSPYTPAVLARFWAKVDRRGPNECWEWTAARHDRGGYGLLNVGGFIARANRIALEVRLGRALTAGMVARHTCDNPPCCNPSHLVEGTQLDNMRDAKSRSRHKHGERGALKMTGAAVISIRNDVSAGMSVAEAASKYGISQSMASMVTSGTRWAHIGGPITSGVRKSHCVNGHEFTPENTIVRNGGLKRVCRTCNNINQARYRAKRKAA